MLKIEKGLITKSRLPEGFVITDFNIAKNYSKLIKDRSFIMAGGEQSKTGENYLRIAEKIGGKERIIAFGGGVVGDLAGFIASTYKRGIPLIQVPTSLLAMVDSSIGGKNGINLGNNKNYLGTIYQPEEILIDPCFLDTLPEKEFGNGIAEISKYGFLFEKPSLDRLEKGVKVSDNDLERIIYDCVQEKLKVVEEDEIEEGYRDVLNFGHTIGHAIELIYNLSHGEAISIGMVKELELGGRMEEADRLRKILKINGLPTEFPNNFNPEEVLEIMRSDKKGEFVFAFDKDNYHVQLNEDQVRDFLKC